MFKLSDKEGLKYVTDDITKSRNELVQNIEKEL